jgi:hypothetical protein
MKRNLSQPLFGILTVLALTLSAFGITPAYAATPPVITEGGSVSVIVSENSSPTPFALTLHATDADLDPLTWSILTPAGFGSASVVAGEGVVHYLPLPNYNGADSFDVQVSDGNGSTDSITVNITIQPEPYTGPLLFNQSYGIVYDTWIGVSGVSAAFDGGEREGGVMPGAAPSGGGYRKATSGIFTFKPNFAFTQVKWLTYRGPDQGKAQVLVDGVVKTTVDLYRATPQWQYLVTLSGLKNTKHTISIRAMNAKNALSAGKWVVVDGFKIGATSYDDNKIGGKAEYTYGSWLGRINRSAYANAYRISDKANASMNFFFEGVTLDWVTACGPAYGKADIYVDGVLKQTVDLYSASQQWQYKVTISDLMYGTHIVLIKVLGAKNPASTGTGIVSDGFIIN